MNHGTRPAELNKYDRSFHRSFPEFAAATPVTLPLMDYTFDAGYTMPDQNADGFPYACTGYTQADICGDEDHEVYDPIYTYDKTCLEEGHGRDRGCDIRNSMESLLVYGLKLLDETTEDNAPNRRRGLPFSVDKAPGRDWFDSFRIALRNNHRSISVGTPWFAEFDMAQQGVVTDQFVYSGRPEDYPWHNWKICGEIVRNGEPMLRCKSWQGRNVGDHGWLYFGRNAFNRAFDIWGTIALTPGAANPQDIVLIKVHLYQQVLRLLNRILMLLNPVLKTAGFKGVRFIPVYA